MTAQAHDTITGTTTPVPTPRPARRADAGTVRLSQRDIDGLLLCGEHYEGREALVAGLKRSRATILAAEKRTPGMAVIHDNLREISSGRAPNGIVYQKGGWTLHMLRGQVGTETRAGRGTG